MKVFIDPGHGGHDPGAVSKGYQEKVIALAICHELATDLQLAGHNVKMSRTDDSFIGLTNRCMSANLWPADVFVSVHLNADPDDDAPGTHEAKGDEIWIYPGSVKGRKLAECIAAEIKKDLLDEPWRGIKEDDLAVVRMTKMPACLIEVGFIDNSDTMRELSDPVVRKQLAKAIANGIVAYFM